jgi:hypothetical protein
MALRVLKPKLDLGRFGGRQRKKKDRKHEKKAVKWHARFLVTNGGADIPVCQADKGWMNSSSRNGKTAARVNAVLAFPC